MPRSSLDSKLTSHPVQALLARCLALALILVHLVDSIMLLQALMTE